MMELGVGFGGFPLGGVAGHGNMLAVVKSVVQEGIVWLHKLY